MSEENGLERHLKSCDSFGDEATPSSYFDTLARLLLPLQMLAFCPGYDIVRKKTREFDRPHHVSKFLLTGKVNLVDKSS